GGVLLAVVLILLPILISLARRGSTGLVVALVAISAIVPFMIAGDDYAGRILQAVNYGSAPAATPKMVLAGAVGWGSWLLALLISFVRATPKQHAVDADRVARINRRRDPSFKIRGC